MAKAYAQTKAAEPDAHTKDKQSTAPEPKANGNASSAKSPIGVDASKPGQALGLILKADASLASFEAIASKLMTKAQNPDASDETLTEMIRALETPKGEADGELDAAWQVLHRHILDLADNEHQPIDQVLAAVHDHPGMKAAVDRVTLKLAHALSYLGGAADRHPNLRGAIESAHGALVTKLDVVRGNVGMDAMHYDGLIHMVEVRVGANMFDLKTGNPSNKLEQSATMMALAWDRSIGNFSTAVADLVGIIGQEDFKKAEPGFVEKIWEVGKNLLEKGAEVVAGTPLAAKIGLAAINQLLSYQEKLESDRVQHDKETFLANLREMTTELQKSGNQKQADEPVSAGGPGGAGGSQFLTQVVSELEDEFLKLGAKNPDAWKQGDRAVFGPQADFLRNIVARGDSAMSSVPTTADFRGQFLTQWINVNDKERSRTAWRSPLAGPTYQDGYVEVPLTLDYSGGRWFLVHPTAGSLHCPNAGAVATSLKESIKPFSLSAVHSNVHLDITATDAAKDHLPETWGDERAHEVRLDAARMVSSSSTKRFWDWLQSAAQTSADDVLYRITDLKGA